MCYFYVMWIQLVITLALLGTAIAGRLDHLESQYLPPTGRAPGTSQYSGTPSNQFAGLNTFPGSTATQYTQVQQPIALGTTSAGFQRQQGQYYSGIQDGRYDGARGQYATQYSGAATVRAESQANGGDGVYSYSFETSNGISAQESGTGSVGAQGGYSYTSPEGEVISVRYTADADGFHPEGTHIPGSEAIRKSIEVNKAEAASGRYQEGQYQDQGYDGSAQQYDATARGQFRQQYATSGQQYNSPNQQYGAPGVRQNLAFTGPQQYGAPSQQQQFGDAQQQYRTPGQQYGAPAVRNQLASPFQQQYSTPVQQYGASSQYNTPSQQYDASRQSQFGFGRQHSQQIGQQYGAPSSRSTFGARQGFGVPAPQYGPPTGSLRSEDSNQGYRY
ncbi:unnamed protein product [Callosobruchus maculatus]|uniref:Uncharacterized protein n=1 Tax=Callosobruchus maculatus TaxID=64391 RepID=A0A653BJI6_CALMS|nr:unnamed protein product [Callosobruchus maculatus]